MKDTEQPRPPLLISPKTREHVDTMLAGDRLSGGIILHGPRSVGKRALADHIAAAVFDSADSLSKASARTLKLVYQHGHPDLMILERTASKGSDQLRGEIAVDDVRGLIERTHRTVVSGRRVIIVDLADDLNRASANALLKILEEPPPATAFLLVSSTPGRLIATVRSRCRRLAVLPVADALIAEAVQRTGDLTADAANRIAAHAQGCPGRAFAALESDTDEAEALATALLNAAIGSHISAAGDLLASRAHDDVWEQSIELMLDHLSRAVRQAELVPTMLSGRDPARQLAALDALTGPVRHAIATNADRTQIGVMIAQTFRRTGLVV